MTGYQIISDLQRVVRTEAESGMSNQPVRPDKIREPRAPVVAGVRLGMTIALRRLADALEPAPRIETYPSPKSGDC